MSKVRKTWASYVAVLDQKLQRQLPPFVTTLLTVKCSSVMEQVFDVLEQVIIYANGSSHLSHQIDHAFQKLQWRSADHYAKQIALLHKANQETEKRLQELEKVKQKMEDMVVHYTPLVAEAEQHIQRAAESISSQHQQALRLKDKQTKIQLEPVLARLEKLLERQEAQWKEAIETLKDFKTAQEHLQNARREEREAQKLIAAALAENS